MFKIIKNLLLCYKIYIKYLISGVTSALVNFSSLYILTEFVGLHYLFSAVMAFFISFAVSFHLQRNWTFRSKSPDVIRQMAKYFIIAGVNLAIDTVSLYWLVDRVGMWYMLAQVLVYGSLAIFSFVLYKFIVFKENVLPEREINQYE